MSKSAYRRTQLADIRDEQRQRSDQLQAWELAALFFFFAGIVLPLMLALFNAPFWTGLSEGARVAWILPNVFLFAFCMLESRGSPD